MILVILNVKNKYGAISDFDEIISNDNIRYLNISDIK